VVGDTERRLAGTDLVAIASAAIERRDRGLNLVVFLRTTLGALVSLMGAEWFINAHKLVNLIVSPTS
jgi:hypothetical protein